MLAVALSKGLSEESELLLWVRLVATALLAAVVVKIVLTPSGALGSVPFWARVTAVPLAIGALFAARKSIVAAVLAGEAVILLSSLFK